MTRQPDSALQVSVHSEIAEVGRDEWNRIAGDRYPFLSYEFLHAAEASGSVSDETGWFPCHLALRHDDGRVRALMPLYEKHHSWGEFVFDWAWANAYERAGLHYYPKLVSAVPFTPAPSSRLLLESPEDLEAGSALLAAAVRLAEDRECSSIHILFPSDQDRHLLESGGFRVRKDCQFHWHNRGYASFDDFLGTFSSAKRKKARRDRRRVHEAGISFRWLDGHQLDADDWLVAYRLISRTFMQRGSLPYYNLDFFRQLSAEHPDSVRVVFADDLAGPVAAAVFFVGSDTLYGRYWGSEAHYNALHFETCYYQGIDFCIENGISTFEPGTQGEHKISRGFVPEATWSAHWLAHPEFFSAISAYVDEEAKHIDRYMEAVDRHSPYRCADDQPEGHGEDST